MREADIPLKVLICDAAPGTALSLRDSLAREPNVPLARVVGTIREAQAEIRATDINTIFIDVAGLGIDKAAQFVFSVRKALPEIVFVLYVDIANVESKRDVFYAGDRRRFSHYYVLDKNTPLSAFDEEVRAVVWQCRTDLSRRMSEASLARLANEVRTLPGNRPADSESLAAQLEKLVSMVARERRAKVTPNSVFLSHRFEEAEWIDGLSSLLASNGFTVIDAKNSSTYIGQAILERIQEAEFFLCLMSKYKRKDDGLYTTSPWLLEEKGAALALRKRIVLMVEEGVDDYGGLQGDWQRIHFSTKGFTKAALIAVEQLKSYTGG